MKIINSVAEGKLREWKAKTDPISGDVRNIIEEDPTDRQVAQLLEGGGMGDSVQDRAGAVGLEGKGNKPGKSTGLVLKFVAGI